VEQGDSAATLSYPDSSEPVTKIRNNFIKVGDRGSSKSRTFAGHEPLDATVHGYQNKKWETNLTENVRRNSAANTNGQEIKNSVNTKKKTK
jgi:hypothetical protein